MNTAAMATPTAMAVGMSRPLDGGDAGGCGRGAGRAPGRPRLGVSWRPRRGGIGRPVRVGRIGADGDPARLAAHRAATGRARCRRARPAGAGRIAHRWAAAAVGAGIGAGRVGRRRRAGRRSTPATGWRTTTTRRGRRSGPAAAGSAASAASRPSAARSSAATSPCRRRRRRGRRAAPRWSARRRTTAARSPPPRRRAAAGARHRHSCSWLPLTPEQRSPPTSVPCGSDLEQFLLFAAERLVDQLDVVVGDLLQFLLGPLELVGRDLPGLLRASMCLRASRRMLRTAMRPSSAMCLTMLHVVACGAPR